MTGGREDLISDADQPRAVARALRPRAAHYVDQSEPLHQKSEYGNADDDTPENEPVHEANSTVHLCLGHTVQPLLGAELLNHQLLSTRQLLRRHLTLSRPVEATEGLLHALNDLRSREARLTP